MGKGKRTKEAFEQAKIIELEKKAIEAKNKRKNNLVTLIVVASLALFSAVAIGGTFWYNTKSADGSFMRAKTAIKTENFKINASMAQYFFGAAIQSYTSQNSEYLEDMGLDTTKDLKKQPSYEDEEKSWYEYFLDNAEAQMYEVLALCEAAKEKGYELSKADEKTITETLSAIEENAENESKTADEYIAGLYGEKVNIEDIENSLRLTTLASKYYTEYVESLTYTDSEISAHFNENKETFLTADYIYFPISNDATGEESDAELKILNDKAKRKASKLIKADSRKEFEENLSEYLEDYFKTEGAKLEKDELKAQIESAISTYTATDSPYETETALGKWVFASSRRAGDTAVIEDTENGGYFAVYLIAPAQKDESETKTARHILLGIDDYESEEECQKAAEKLLKEWRNGDKTEASFAEMAKAHSTDTGSAAAGGLYENVERGVMVEEFENWIFASSRRAGDTGIVKTTYGSHIMYFVSDGLAAWQGDVVNSLKNNSYTEALEELKEKYKATTKRGNLELVEYILEEAEEEEEALDD